MGTVAPASFEHLPGAGLIAKGIEDLEHDRQTIEAVLVSIGATRLRALGITVTSPIPAPEHRLYSLLAQEDPDSAHSRFNALVRRLVSFERAAECAS